METAEKGTNRTTVLTTGLVLGKFAPLHKGHQFLIETARAQCDVVMVLIYDSREVIDIPLHVRADWIRTLYPDVIVVEGWDGPSASGDAPEIKALQERYIARVLPRAVTHVFSSEWYGDHVAEALGAVHVKVDETRETVPISGTRVRSNPHTYRSFLDPYVYKDFVKKVVLLGGESTGKSTLVQMLAKEFRTKAVVEYGRDFWEMHHDAHGQLSLVQLVELAESHRHHEDQALVSANEYVFVDTNAITTRYYSQLYHGVVHPELERLARLCAERYDKVFVCGTDIPFEQDGTRQDAAHREVMQRALVRQLEEWGIPFVLLSGSVAERVRHVKNHL